MGNWFGRSSLTVKPLENVIGMTKKIPEEDERRKSFDLTSSLVRIKVRMTKRQLEKMRTRAGDKSRGNSELGRLIVNECFEGRLSPIVVVGQDHVLDNSRSTRRLSLSTIDEEGIEN